MKASIPFFAAALALAGCHADRGDTAAPTGPSATSSSSAKTDKALEKSRDSMLGKNMSIDSQHWASSPAAASTATKPATATTPTGTPAAAASPSVKASGS